MKIVRVNISDFSAKRLCVFKKEEVRGIFKKSPNFFSGSNACLHCFVQILKHLKIIMRRLFS